MRVLLPLASFALIGGCGPQGGGDTATEGPPLSGGDCPLAMEWQASGPAGGMGAFVINPDGEMAWSVHGGGEGSAELNGRDLFMRFNAPAHEFQVNATLTEDCRSGEGMIDVRRYPGEGQTGTFPITLQAGRADAWRDHYALREGAED